VVDQNGVPVFVRSTGSGSLDLKRQLNGHYSTALVGTDTPGRSGSQIVELDSSFREIGRYETVGLQDTDGHDAVLLPNGHRILLSYEPDAGTGNVDAVIQEVDALGSVVFSWDSASLVGESVVADSDYAHVNSVSVMSDGDLLASFRHLSAVLKIARSAHDGFQPGDIVWRLGGRQSDFTFVDDPFPGGPCAQHAASELDNGDILIFDNGSGGISANMCLDPADRLGATIARTQTRVTQYRLDPASGTATLVWDWSSPGSYGFFAGSAQRLPNGNTMVGWAAVRGAMASEVSPAGQTLWSLRDAAAGNPGAPFYSTYRALKFDAPDTIDPVIEVKTPAVDASYELGQKVTVRLVCADRGGSSLEECGTNLRSGDRLDTSTPGTHTVDLVASDGAGNSAMVEREYTVGERPPQPDAQIRRLPSGVFVGKDIIGGRSGQTVRQSVSRTKGSVRARVRVQNVASAAGDRFVLKGTRSGAAFRVAYFANGTDVTSRVKAGTFRTGRLAPGRAFVFTVRVTRTRAARPGQSRVVSLRARSVSDPRRSDVVATRVRVFR
jgi:hypothetical protein